MTDLHGTGFEGQHLYSNAEAALKTLQAAQDAACIAMSALAEYKRVQPNWMPNCAEFENPSEFDTNVMAIAEQALRISQQGHEEMERYRLDYKAVNLWEAVETPLSPRKEQRHAK